ncbi:aldo/keto reductase [Candidatus Laterigemmans baculatus]|uniref:aldo/keto reductase n=1 Tax=Candidatus Laterigemmans baculatus TaxID=2770505 RepID=UPI0013DA9EF3|nr:aldo/keto reductase [Candidatus Laterigemmans baculatus]
MSDLVVSPVVLGLWPIAGVTSVGVTPELSRQTIRAALDAGVTTFDTAFSYGYDGESDRLLGEMLAAGSSRRREGCVVISKVGQRWTADRKRVTDASPATLVADAEDSLRRIGIERFDLLMLHSVDPEIDVRRSIEALEGLRERGLAARIGLCNADFPALLAAAEAGPLSAVQWPLNLLQREVLDRRVEWCREQGIAVHTYWGLMKGLLAGRIDRQHVFDPGDSRPGYAIYQGAARERAHRVIDRLRQLGEEAELTVAQLSLGWVLSQPGVSSVLVGAKRPEQIRETARARPLSPELVAEIDAAVGASGWKA